MFKRLLIALNITWSIVGGVMLMMYYICLYPLLIVSLILAPFIWVATSFNILNLNVGEIIRLNDLFGITEFIHRDDGSHM